MSQYSLRFQIQPRALHQLTEQCIDVPLLSKGDIYAPQKEWKQKTPLQSFETHQHINKNLDDFFLACLHVPWQKAESS
ncbi:MAG: hypothetical protein UU08_C0003G0042 [Candidatus Uhrbacteria bacterium GW2011_GWE2_40_58]|nr:MAG: hypothetical protein UU08_C0003G0042 [Candidatus Uhrbacteria bacterium GW2011_GWE2_40_58]